MERSDINGISIEHISLSKGNIFFAEILDVNHRNIWYKALDNFERDNANKFKFQIDADRFSARRFLAKFLLNKFITNYHGSLNFSYNRYGKPFILNFPVSFNWSHSENYIAFSYSEFSHAGVDIEYINEKFDYSDMWDVVNVDDLLQSGHINFFKLWTAKEALSKCKGNGISDSFEKPGIFSFDNASNSLSIKSDDYSLIQIKHSDCIISLVTSNS